MCLRSWNRTFRSTGTPEDDLVLRAPALVLVGVPLAVLAPVLSGAVLEPVDDAGSGQGVS